MGTDHEDWPSGTNDVPQIVEMDRSDSGPPVCKPRGLKAKLRAHYEKGIPKPQVKGDPLASILTPQFINRVAVPVYIFTVLSTFKIGFFDVMPQIYAGQENLILLQQGLVVLIFLQVMVNWCGIRYVDSGFARWILLYGKPKLSQVWSAGQQMKSSNTGSNAVLSPPGGLLSPEAVILNATGSSDNSEIALHLEAEYANSEMIKQQKQEASRSIADLMTSRSLHDTKVAMDTCSTWSHNSRGNDFSSSEISSTARTGGIGGTEASSVSSQLDNHKQQGFASSSTKITQENGQRIKIKTYPYWSWAPCFECRWTRPPRCHHCPVCRTCVLKRDHHCFFAGACVGYRNLRFFFVFLVWAWLGCMYATIHGFPYIYLFLWEQHMAYVDIAFPVAIARFFVGYVPLQVALSVTTLSLLIYFDFLTLTFIYAHFRLIGWGLTSFEKACLNRRLEIRDSRSWRRKYRAVFGKNWAISFLLPVGFFYEPEEDPINWPHIVVIKHTSTK